MGEIELFTSKLTPFGQRVQIALTEKNIPFKAIVCELSNKPQGLLDANPIHKKVPAIIHDGKHVAESLVILEYLEEEFPEQVPLMPKDAYQRSQIRFWTDYIYKLFATFSGSVRMKPGTPEKQAAAESIIVFLKTIESAMTSYSAEGPFFTGDKFGYLDVILAPFCNSVVVLEQLSGVVFPGPDELPRLHKWIAEIKVRPSCAFIPSGEQALLIYKAHIAAAAKAAAAAST